MAYFLTVAGQQKGPHNKDEIVNLISEGAVSLDDLVWVAERNRWLQIKFYPEIASLFQEVAKQRKSISEEYIINVDGKTGGPFPENVIVEEIKKKRLKADHFVWVQDENKWLYVKDHPVFSPYFVSDQAVSTGEKAKRHYIGKDGARFGPFTEEEIRSGILRGDFLREHYFWDNSENKWVSLGSVIGYMDAFEEYDTSLEPEEPPPPQADAPQIEVTPVPAVSTPGTPAATAETQPELEIEVTPQVDIAPAAEHRVFDEGDIAPAVASTSVEPSSIAPDTRVSEEGSGPGTLIDIGKPAEAEEVAVSTITAEEPVELEKVSVSQIREEEITVDITDDYEPSKVTWFKRLGAGFIDLFIPSLSFFAVAIVFELLGRNPYAPGPEQTINTQLFYAIVGGIILGYFLLHDSIGGGGLGKRIMGYRIVGARNPHRNGNVVHSIIRNLFVLIPGLNIIELVLMITNPKGKRMADSLLNTVAMEKIEIDYIRDKQSTVDSIY